MYSPHIAKERSHSCLFQLSNIMPIRTGYICTICSVSLFWNMFLCVKMSSRNIIPLNTGVLHHAPTSAALLNLQCQVLQNFHLTDIAIHGSLWHRHGILFPIFDEFKIIQILIRIYPGKKHSWLAKGNTKWSIVVNSYPSAECDYQIHLPQDITLHHCALQTQGCIEN